MHGLLTVAVIGLVVLSVGIYHICDALAKVSEAITKSSAASESRTIGTMAAILGACPSKVPRST